MDKYYVRTSPVAEYIDGLLEEKRSLGYSYIFEEYLLNEFDNYCVINGLSEPGFARDFLSGWLAARNGEGASYHRQRISFVRQLSLYMNALGIRAYVPVMTVKQEYIVPHFLSSEERKALFRILDNSFPQTAAAYAWRMWNEYRVIFRLLYCCGMRNSEACCLRPEDVDLVHGKLSIIHSKGDKDRVVYMPDDLRLIMTQYWSYLIKELEFMPSWFFPSRYPEKHIHKTSLDQQFNKAWALTPYASSCARKPTVHCLRHSFVVDRMNAWAREGLSYGQMLPYLSKYLGHRGVGESLYYFHLSEEANRLIRMKDRTAGRVIPGVEKYAK